MVKIIHQPHDKLFKKSMADLRVAKDFFEEHLPQEILQRTDLNTLVLQKETFIDDAYKDSEADVLYQVLIDNIPVFLYLLCEHQSKIDQFMAFRLLCYIVLIMQTHRAKYPKTPLPLIYPIVLYSGEKEWNAPEDVFELFEPQHQALAKDLLLQPYHLIDLTNVSDDELKKHKWSGLMESVLKYRTIQNTIDSLDQLFPWIQEIEIEHGDNFCRIVLKYVIDLLDPENEQIFNQKAEKYLGDRLRGEIMTLTQHWEQRGEQRGMQQGMHQREAEIAKNMLLAGADLSFVEKTTGLDHKTVKELQEKTKH